ncbi:MAG: hypothetical protein MH204_09230, partial [Fimbriimonadaceae bacterium]|nr:hypothetical protein [Fimbriimonadaceae bacterium]
MKIGVVGASGFMGGEAVRLLLGHPFFEIGAVCGHSTAGRRLDEVRPGLGVDLEIQEPDPDMLADLGGPIILALPHGASADLAEELLKRGASVIDLGSDFRLKDPAEVEKWYRRGAPRQALLDAAWYGLPELTGPPPAGCRLVAVPGCFATGLCLGLAPLAGLGLDRVSVFGVTGSSGSGVSPSPGVHHSTRVSGFVAYKPLSHQHMGEVGALLKARNAEFEVDFIPHSAPLPRGIHLTILVPAQTESVRARFAEAYAESRLIRLRSAPVNLGSVQGSCRVEIGIVAGGDRTVVTVALDNLL